MEAETKYLQFELVRDTGKTQVWEIHSRKGHGYLGDVRWLGRWRCYAFFPAQNTVFNKTCLKDIQEFIDQLMSARRDDGICGG